MRMGCAISDGLYIIQYLLFFKKKERPERAVSRPFRACHPLTNTTLGTAITHGFACHRFAE